MASDVGAEISRLNRAKADMRALMEEIGVAIEESTTLDEYADIIRKIIPHVGENGNWYVGDTDTGIPARGPDGKSAFETAAEAGYSGSEAELAEDLAQLQHGPFVPKTGGEVTGNLDAKVITGTMLRATDDTHISSKQEKVCVYDETGAICHRTVTELFHDIGVGRAIQDAFHVDFQTYYGGG